MRNPDDLADRLAEPFDPSEVRWKPAAVSGNRALAIAFIDARTVMQRLDDVLGVTGWADAYRFLPDGSCVCKLSCCVAGHWLSKMDVGGPSEQEDEGDRRKAAASDAIKRAAVQWGVARYLYRIPRTWVDSDPKTKQLTPPVLPAWARPWLSPRDAEALVALLAQTGTDPGKFCPHYGIESPGRLPAALFAEAQARLIVEGPQEPHAPPSTPNATARTTCAGTTRAPRGAASPPCSAPSSWGAACTSPCRKPAMMPSGPLRPWNCAWELSPTKPRRPWPSASGGWPRRTRSRGSWTPRSRSVYHCGRATSPPGRVVPNSHAAGPTAGDEIADDQLGPAVAVQVTGGTRQVVARLRFEGVAHELPRGDLFQQDDGLQPQRQPLGEGLQG
jgi:hypothetical protein